MGKFDYKKWVTENKFGSQQLNEIDVCFDHDGCYCNGRQHKSCDRAKSVTDCKKCCYNIYPKMGNIDVEFNNAASMARTSGCSPVGGNTETSTGMRPSVIRQAKKVIQQKTDPTAMARQGGIKHFTTNHRLHEGKTKYNKKGKIPNYVLRNLIKESIQEILLEQNWMGESCSGFVYNTDPEWPGCLKCLSNQSAGTFDPGEENNIQWPGSPTPSQPTGVETVGPDCNCCKDEPRTTGGELDCPNPEWVAQNMNAAGKCWICRNETNNCVQLNSIPMAASVALANGFNLYNNMPDCNANEECGPGTHGSKCDPTDGTYYGFNNGEPRDDHNERWGRDCWFCKEDNMPGCTEILSPMLQGEAFAAYLAGTSSIHSTQTGCNAVEKCGDDGTGNNSLKCTCCGPSGLPVSPIPNPNYKSCSSHNGQNGMYGCADVATFDPKSCKKPGTGIPTNPNVFDKRAPKSGGDIRAIREAILKLLNK